MDRGRIHIYTGDGKGKTTAALGLILRASGHSFRCALFQFCKNSPSGEVKAAAHLESVQVFRADTSIIKFIWQMTPEEREVWRDAQRTLFDQACEAATEGKYDLVVLDEAMGALQNGVVDTKQLLYLMAHKHPGTELVLTGRAAPEELISAADYVTQMQSARHPMDAGLHARKGVEF